MRRYIPVLIMSIGMLTACGAAGAPAASQPTAAVAPALTAAPAPTGAPAANTAPTAGPATPVAVAVPTAMATSGPLPSAAAGSGNAALIATVAPGNNATADAMVALAKDDLAKRLGVAADTVQLQSIEEVEWNNSALGCARPDVAYMQVITPGYKMLLAAGGKTYDYRSDMRRAVLLCEDTPKLK